MRELKTPVTTAVVTLLLFFVLARFLGPVPFSVNSVQTTKTNLFTVQGVGEAAGAPDTATLSLGVTKNASTVATAQQQANEVTNKLIADLKALGIEEKNIKTTNYSVNPQYNFSSGTQTINGYSVTQTLTVKVKPLDKVNQAIDKATAAGANTIGDVQFTVSDETKNQLEDTARKEAIQKAKDKAASLAGAAGIRLGRIVDVQESSDQLIPRPFMEVMPMAADKAIESRQTTVTPGENTIRITVTLAYETF